MISTTRFASTREHGEEQDCPHDDRIVAIGDAGDEVFAHARNAENLLGDEGAGEQGGEHRPQDGDHGNHELRMACRMMTMFSFRPLARAVRM